MFSGNCEVKFLEKLRSLRKFGLSRANAGDKMISSPAF
jgi:hypothetical protein